MLTPQIALLSPTSKRQRVEPDHQVDRHELNFSQQLLLANQFAEYYCPEHEHRSLNAQPDTPPTITVLPQSISPTKQPATTQPSKQKRKQQEKQ